MDQPLKDLYIKQNVKFNMQMSTMKSFQISADADILAHKMLQHARTHIPGFKFQHIQQLDIIKYFRQMIKQQDRFKKFLEQTGFDKRQFFQLCIYIMPQLFTSHLIKFIRLNYLNCKDNS